MYVNVYFIFKMNMLYCMNGDTLVFHYDCTTECVWLYG
jgi:hypothetical protein